VRERGRERGRERREKRTYPSFGSTKPGSSYSVFKDMWPTGINSFSVISISGLGLPPSEVAVSRRGVDCLG